MSDLSGYSFSPDLANRFRTSLNSPTGAGPLPSNVGQALQVLSLHLPNVLSGNPIAPDALLRGNRGFTPDAAVRSMTTGSPSLPPSALPPPRSAPMGGQGQPDLSVFHPSPSPGPSPGPAPPPPPTTFRFSNPTTPSPSPSPSPAPPGPSPLPNFTVTNPTPSPSPTVDQPTLPPAPAGPPVGGGGGNPLADLLDAFMRGGGGGQNRL